MTDKMVEITVICPHCQGKFTQEIKVEVELPEPEERDRD